VTLVRMGSEGRERSLEDDVCADYLACLLRGEPYDTASVRERLAEAPSARKFFDPQFTDAPRADFDLCTEVDRFGFALQLEGRQSASPWLSARAV
jgi:2-phosphosulfolactate phosphatase